MFGGQDRLLFQVSGSKVIQYMMADTSGTAQKLGRQSEIFDLKSNIQS